VTTQRKNPWLEFANLLEGLAVQGGLKRRATVEALERFADSFEDPIDQTIYRGALGLSLGEIGDFAGAERIIAKSSDAQERADYWLRLGEQQLKAGQQEGALKSFRLAETDIETIRSDYRAERAHVLSEEAKLLDQYGLHREAAAAWDRAIGIARAGQETNPNGSDCSAVLVNIVDGLVKQQRLDLARSVADSITPRFPGRREHAFKLIERASDHK
jgi:tetratricopeptide (TPR) repeat protein